jgi:hypothetical protein
MPQNHAKRKGSRKSRSSNSGVVAQLKQLVKLTQDYETKRPPRVRDIGPCSLKPSRLFNVVSSYFSQNVTPSATLFTSGAVFFQLSYITDYVYYTQVFDAYRVVQLEVQFIPHVQAGSGAQVPLFYTCIDYDDNNAPSNGAIIMQYDSCQINPSTVLVSRNLAPKASLSVYTGGVAAGYAQSSGSSWFDCASSGIDFYGVKFGIESAPSAVVYYEVIVTAFVQFKFQR